MASLFDTDEMTRGADFSECRTYRYTLWRIWDGSLNACMFIGLNPSTADETTDDATIRKCIKFARSWGYGSLYMLNLFAYRSTDPKKLAGLIDPIGPDNDEALAYYRSKCGLIVAAWGADKSIGTRGHKVCEVLGRRLDCLGTNNNGSPRHPLYIRDETKPTLFYSPKQ